MPRGDDDPRAESQPRPSLHRPCSPGDRSAIHQEPTLADSGRQRRLVLHPGLRHPRLRGAVFDARALLDAAPALHRPGRGRHHGRVRRLQLRPAPVRRLPGRPVPQQPEPVRRRHGAAGARLRPDRPGHRGHDVLGAGVLPDRQRPERHLHQHDADAALQARGRAAGERIPLELRRHEHRLLHRLRRGRPLPADRELRAPVLLRHHRQLPGHRGGAPELEVGRGPGHAAADGHPDPVPAADAGRPGHPRRRAAGGLDPAAAYLPDGGHHEAGERGGGPDPGLPDGDPPRPARAQQHVGVPHPLAGVAGVLVPVPDGAQRPAALRREQRASARPGARHRAPVGAEHQHGGDRGGRAHPGRAVLAAAGARLADRHPPAVHRVAAADGARVPGAAGGDPPRGRGRAGRRSSGCSSATCCSPSANC